MFWNRPAQSLKKPKENSFDFKLMMAFFVCMVVLMMSNGALSLDSQIDLAAVLVVGFVASSYLHRRKRQWHWRGASGKNIFSALVTFLVGILLFYPVSLRMSPSDPRFFPIFALCSAIYFFNILLALKIVSTYESEFLQSCGKLALLRPDLPIIPGRPSWKSTIRMIFRGFALAVALAFIAFFWEFNTAFSKGTSARTAERTETLSDHGKIVFITPEEKYVIEILESIGTGGISLVFLIGFLLEKVVKIEVFDHPKKD